MVRSRRRENDDHIDSSDESSSDETATKKKLTTTSNRRRRKNNTGNNSSSDDEYQPRVRKRSKASSKKPPASSSASSSKKKSAEEIAFEAWAKQQNQHFSSIDNTRLVDDSESFFQYTSDNDEKSNKTTSDKNANVTGVKNVKSDNKVDDGGSAPTTTVTDFDLSFELQSSTSTAPDIGKSSSTSSSDMYNNNNNNNSVVTDATVPPTLTDEEVQMKQKYPTLYTEYLEYRRAILGIVEPLPFAEFVEQNGIGV